MRLRAVALAAICAALTGCAVSHGTAASTPTPFPRALRDRIQRYYHVPSPPPPTPPPQQRIGLRPPQPDPVRATWARRGYTTLLSDDGKTLYLSGRPGTARIARTSGNLVWFTAMSCSAGLPAGDDLYAACGGHVVKLNASTGETMQRSTPIPFAVSALEFAGPHAIAVKPETSRSPGMSPLFLDRDTLRSVSAL